MHSSPSTILGFEARRRLAERTAPVFGLVGFVLTDRDDAAGFGHAEHGVPQLGIGRPHVGRHDRVQVSAPHRGQVAAGASWGDGPGGRSPPRNHWSWWAFRPRADRGSRRRRWRWSTPASSRRAGWPAPRTRFRRSRRTASCRTDLSSRGQSADLVEDLLVPQQGRVGVHHALRGARRARRVHDGQRIRVVDVVLPSPRAACRRRCPPGSESIRTWRSSGAAP